jgi:hypothetical protein
LQRETNHCFLAEFPGVVIEPWVGKELRRGIGCETAIYQGGATSQKKYSKKEAG